MKNIILKDFIILLLTIIITLLKSNKSNKKNNKGIIRTEKKRIIKSKTKNNFYILLKFDRIKKTDMPKEENLKWVELESHILNQI